MTRLGSLAIVLAVGSALVACMPKTGPLPERKDGALARADRAYARGDLAKAEAGYTRVIERGGIDAGEARYLRARVRLERGDLAGSEGDVEAVLAVTPAHWEALCVLGLVRERQGRRAEAMAELRKALRIAPGELSPRNNLAYLELAEGNTQAAYDLLVEVVRDHPESARAWANLAQAAERLGLPDEAARARERAAAAAEADSVEPQGGGW